MSSISKVQASSRAGSAIASVVRADRDYAEDIFAELRAGSVSGAGVTRDAYGKGEQLAHHLVVRHALALGLEIRISSMRRPFLLAGCKKDWLKVRYCRGE